MAHGHNEHHIMPLKTYLKVAGALFLLTFLTVGAHVLREHFEPFSAVIAFAIASVKAYLVMAFFMHLKYDVPSNRLIFATGFLFLALLFGICMLDIYTRIFQGNVL
ncbi:MAG: cytochrome C oxidase subunit IV family protein [Bdellovibrionaceae bacterium]|nr:cytochrome C oxidase subunit IV family protein [Bdellovibrio sp.]